MFGNKYSIQYTPNIPKEKIKHRTIFSDEDNHLLTEHTTTQTLGNSITE
jgi:hypothetical protein